MLSTAKEQEEVSIVPRGWAVCEHRPPEMEKEKEAIKIGIGKFQIEVTEGIDNEHLMRVCQVLVRVC